MNEFNVSIYALKDIIENGGHFQSTIKKYLTSRKEVERPILSALVGCELRHHLVFDMLITSKFPNLVKDDLYFALLIALANKLFAKRIDEGEVEAFLSILLNNLHPELDSKEVLSFLSSVNDTATLIPADVPITSLEFKSYRFNTPLWLIKMWQKHYGPAKATKILKANTKSQKISCFVNTKYSSMKEVLDTHLFAPFDDLKNVVIYLGKSPLKKNDFFRNFDVFMQKLAVSDMIYQLSLPSVLDILIYAEDYSTVFGSLTTLYNKENLKMELAVPSLENRVELLRLVKLNKLNNIHLFASSKSALIAHLHETYPYVIYAPRNSNFDIIRSQPDYLIHFKQEMLDSFIANQKEGLEELAKFVSPDGYLIYHISTLSKKEGRGLIATFLEEHKEFSLELEKEYFPYDKFDTCFYFAKLKKSSE